MTLKSPLAACAAQLLVRVSAGALALTCAFAFAQEEPQLNLQRVNIGAGMYQIDSQVAFTPEQRQIGLMFRKAMPGHEGMLFVFEQPSTQCFWMKNTVLPLSAAFVADDGSIVNIVDMKPQTTDSHCSLKPVRFVLEVNQGWFAKRRIQAGFKLTGKPFEAGKQEKVVTQ
ncbi:DUF192 domain-containing protein [soil metagenome]